MKTYFNEEAVPGLQEFSIDVNGKTASVIMTGRISAQNIRFINEGSVADQQIEALNLAAVTRGFFALVKPGSGVTMTQREAMDGINAYLQQQFDTLKNQCCRNIRSIEIEPTRANGLPDRTRVFICGEVTAPDQISIQATESDFLNNACQEFVDYYHMGDEDRKLRAIDLAARAGGNLAVVYTDGGNPCKETILRTISEAGSKAAPERKTPPPAQGWLGAVRRAASFLTPG